MTFPEFCPVEVIMARATHPAHVEAVTPALAARQLYARGYRQLAVHFDDKRLAIAIVRAFEGTGTRLGDGLGSAASFKAVRYELNRICAAAIANPVDPEHIAGVQAETDRCARQMGRARTESEEA